MSTQDAKPPEETNDDVILDFLEVVQPEILQNSGANEIIQNGANDDLQNGVHMSLEKGAKVSIQNGANDDLQDGDNEELQKGDNVSLGKCDTGSLQNGANDNRENVDSDDASKQKESTTACNNHKANCGDSCKLLGRKGPFFTRTSLYKLF